MNRLFLANCLPGQAVLDANAWSEFAAVAGFTDQNLCGLVKQIQRPCFGPTGFHQQSKRLIQQMLKIRNSCNLVGALEQEDERGCVHVEFLILKLSRGFLAI